MKVIGVTGEKYNSIIDESKYINRWKLRKYDEGIVDWQ